MRKVYDIQTGQETTEAAVGSFMKTPEPQDVKDEARRRINQVIPEWKQFNLIAHAAVLAERGRANWSASDLAAWRAGEALWARVKSIREKSDEIEATRGGIPPNFKDDGLWK